MRRLRKWSPFLSTMQKAAAGKAPCSRFIMHYDTGSVLKIELLQLCEVLVCKTCLFAEESLYRAVLLCKVVNVLLHELRIYSSAVDDVVAELGVVCVLLSSRSNFLYLLCICSVGHHVILHDDILVEIESGEQEHGNYTCSVLAACAVEEYCSVLGLVEEYLECATEVAGSLVGLKILNSIVSVDNTVFCLEYSQSDASAGFDRIA